VSAAADPPPGDIEREVVRPENRRCAATGASSDRVNPRNELGEVERLGQIVVGAESESHHAIVQAFGGRQHQDARTTPLLDDPSTDVVSMDAGKVAIQNDDVIGVHGHLLERMAAVEGGVCDDALLPQPLGDRGRELGVVLDDQDLDDRPPIALRG
jgi:hypothetical protein